MITALREEYEGRVSFVIVDVNEGEGRELADEYGILNIPYFIIQNSRGERVFERAGAGEAEIRKALEQVLEEPGPAKFRTTPDPGAAIREGLAGGRALFIEFYSNT